MYRLEADMGYLLISSLPYIYCFVFWDRVSHQPEVQILLDLLVRVLQKAACLSPQQWNYRYILPCLGFLCGASSSTPTLRAHMESTFQTEWLLKPSVIDHPDWYNSLLTGVPLFKQLSQTRWLWFWKPVVQEWPKSVLSMVITTIL